MQTNNNLSPSERIFKLFIDFDGTITTKDVGEEIFLKYGDPVKANEIIALWMDDKITSIETWQRLCETVNNLNRDDFDTFLETIEIDPAFIDFVNYCNSNRIEIRILSDGLDYYINKVLRKYNLDHLEFYSNKLKFDSANRMLPQFPYTDEECNMCANCKRNHIITNSSDEEFTIYVGDGYSDKCPAQYCDFIFAKNSLLKYCEKNRITYFPYQSFYQVQKKVEELKNKKRLKKKVRAELKRKEVYTQG